MTYYERISKFSAAFPGLMLDQSGVYAIESRSTGAVYVGCSRRVLTRVLNHLRALRKQKHGNTYLQRHYDKYGEGDLAISCLELTPNPYEAEVGWVSEFDSYRNGFNRHPGGKGGATPGVLAAMAAGRDTQEYRIALSLRTKQQMNSTPVEERRARARRASNAAYAKMTPEERRAKASAAARKRWGKATEEDRKAFGRMLVESRKK